MNDNRRYDDLEKRVIRIEEYLWGSRRAPDPAREKRIDESIARTRAMMRKLKPKHEATMKRIDKNLAKIKAGQKETDTAWANLKRQRGHRVK